MSARDDILGRVRGGLQRDGANRAAGLARVEAALASRARGPQPAFSPDCDSLIERFTDCSVALSSTVERLDTIGAVPAAVARYCQTHSLRNRAVAWPTLFALPWAEAGITIETRPSHGGDLIGITTALCAVAETGTLLLASSPDTPAATSLLPETHIAVIEAAKILPTMEDAFDCARKALGQLPRALNFVSGPSRTADIEQTLVIGAHGPYRVHLLIVG